VREVLGGLILGGLYLGLWFVAASSHDWWSLPLILILIFGPILAFPLSAGLDVLNHRWRHAPGPMNDCLECRGWRLDGLRALRKRLLHQEFHVR